MAKKFRVVGDRLTDLKNLSCPPSSDDSVQSTPEGSHPHQMVFFHFPQVTQATVLGGAAAAAVSHRTTASQPGMDSSLSQSVLVALSLLLFTALYLACRRRGGSSNQKYPPVAGTILDLLLKFGGGLLEQQTELSRRYRTFRMLAPTCSYVYTVEPANVEYILKTNFANYGKGVMMYDVAKDLLGDGIFNVNGAKWRHQRKVASHEFSTRVLRDYSSAVFRDTAAELAGIVAAAAGAGERVDMQDLLMRSTLDSIFKVGFGVSLGTLSGSNKEGLTFARAFDDASEQVLYRFFDPFWKAKKFLNASSEVAMKRYIRIIDEFVYAVIDKKIEQMGRDQQEFVGSITSFGCRFF
jgi:hypothetical protein